jgi:enoyl-[acyl-carrier protein] reductase I
MGFLANKRILITGMISNRSIAYGVAQAMWREGAEMAFTYQGERIRDRVCELAKEFNSNLIFSCDVTSDAEIDQLFVDLGKHWDKFDGFVHAIAFSPREALAGDFLMDFPRSLKCADISSYSFRRYKAALPMMEGPPLPATLLLSGAHHATLQRDGSSQQLEASVRYLA